MHEPSGTLTAPIVPVPRREVADTILNVFGASRCLKEGREFIFFCALEVFGRGRWGCDDGTARLSSQPALFPLHTVLSVKRLAVKQVPGLTLPVIDREGARYYTGLSRTLCVLGLVVHPIETG